jgi:spermidine synthase
VSVFLRRLCIYLAFFASGAASLIAEVTWNRMLIVVVGNSLSAAAMIIAVFMGGLGFGSFVGGRVFGRRPVSLLPYFFLETLIGVYVLMSPALLDALSALFGSLAQTIDDRSSLTLVRIVVTLAALFVPATLMGATFPAIVSGVARGSSLQRSARTGYLYSVNTLGAAVGCFAAGYHLLFEFGVRFTLIVAFSLYLLAALSALLANLLTRTAAEQPEPAAPAPMPPAGASAASGVSRRFLYTATFAVGFVTLAYEILLTRLSILNLGNSVSVFPLVLTAFLLGTGFSAIAGTWLYGKLQRARAQLADRLFGIASIAAGALMLGTPYLLLTDWIMSARQFGQLADAMPRNPLPVLAIIVAPTILIGALLPVAIRMMQSKRADDTTRSAATLYALNTAGGLIGAALANHFLVPLVGIQGTLLFLVMICALVAAANLRPPRGRAVTLAGNVVAVGVTVGALWLILPGMMNLYAEKIAVSTQAQQTEVRLVHEGRAATVIVLDQIDPRKGTYRDMYLNGVEEASTRYWHVQLFKLLGILPVLVHEPDTEKETLVIAFGAGITAGSVLASDRVTSLDVVDLNPDIEGINEWFTDVNGDVFHKNRFHFQNDDGRNYLVTCRKQYDVIMSDSTHPRAYDSWILYTEEFYRAVKEHLKPGGVFAQWVPVLGSMQGELFRIHLNTFRTVFPNTTFWYVYGSDQAFLLATPEPFAIDAPVLQERLDRLPEWFRAEEYHIDTVARVAGFFWMDDDALNRMIGSETRVNTDDIHYFDKQSAVRPLPLPQRLPFFQAAATPYVRNASAQLVSAIQREQAVAGSLGRYGFFQTDSDLFRAYCQDPDNGNAHYFMSLRFANELPERAEFCRSVEIDSYRAMLASQPGNPLAMNALADLLGEAGELEEAVALAEQAVAAQPENGMILDTYGWILLKRGDAKRALEVLRRADKHLPDHPIVRYHLGAAYRANGNEAAARQYPSTP